jgi:LytS/YehU family sensor histidine kinase
MELFLSELVLSNKTVYRIGRHLLFWVACVFFFVTIYGSFWNYGYNITNTYKEAILFLPAHMFMSYSILYILIPRYLLTGRYISLIIGIIVLLPITAFISFELSQWLITPLRNSQGIEPPSKSLFLGLMAGLRGSNTVAGFAASIKLVKYWYFKKEENAILEKEKLKAELEVLKGQLHPHFLFNTLNNLYSLVLQQSKQAPEVVLKLSELLRYILTESQSRLICLSKELSILRSYIELEQARFGERLELTLNIKGDIHDQKIAPLLLLPLVENAFKHGANEMLEYPWLSLDIAVTEQHLKLKLINGKPATNQTSIFSSGIGLQNLKKRLALIYPNQHQFQTISEEESFIVNLELELRK